MLLPAPDRACLARSSGFVDCIKPIAAVVPVDFGVTRGEAKVGLGVALGEPVAPATGEGEAPLGAGLGVGLA
ncbi:hypothetical protein OSCI_3460061 [Kamptonema sp. PCC 6506]|nr:hypothetical protein OSCI_3460061 [Kamptonema sp. PCC 6506]